jgi:hypothetical protein
MLRCLHPWPPPPARLHHPQHYIPTLLAVHGLDNETYCSIDGLVAADWSAGGAHPKAYK